jgi:hypothetical protein
MYKWPNRCSQLRYRASAIPTTGTIGPVQDYSAHMPETIFLILSTNAYFFLKSKTHSANSHSAIFHSAPYPFMINFIPHMLMLNFILHIISIRTISFRMFSAFAQVFLKSSTHSM